MSNAQQVAFLSFGLILGGGPSTAPIPYDVRLGIDNGDGDLGTLTSPPPANVRAGVQYGGDGTQYMGTLYVPSSAGGTTWTEEMEEIWHEEAEQEWPCTARYESWTFPIVRNPIKSGFQMKLAGYSEQADTTIDMLRTQAQLMGLYGFKQNNPQQKRPILISDSISFQIIFMENDDTAQPSVRFMCLKLQANG